MAGDVAEDDEQAAVAGGLDVEEVAADFGGRGVDGVDVEARSLRGFAGDHQLLHAAGGGELAGGAFALAMDAEEADEDDEDDDEDADEVRDVGKMVGTGPASKVRGDWTGVPSQVEEPAVEASSAMPTMLSSNGKSRSAAS